jgi:hypothetical protein
MLGARLAELGPQLTLPEAPPEDASWWKRLLYRLRSLFKISRVPENGDLTTLPPGPQRSLAEAQAAMAKGDLAGAVAAIENIGPPQSAAVAPWYAAAAARLAAETACDRIDAVVTRRLAGGAAPAAGSPS